MSLQGSLHLEEGGRREGQKDSALLNVKVEEGTMSQEVWATSRKGKKINFPPEPPEGDAALPTLELEPMNLILDFWPQKSKINNSVV